MHADYLEHSPYYRALVDRYGRRLTIGQAAAVCTLHGTTLADLDPYLVDREDNTVGTLALVMDLGY